MSCVCFSPTVGRSFGVKELVKSFPLLTKKVISMPSSFTFNSDSKKERERESEVGVTLLDTCRPRSGPRP